MTVSRQSVGRLLVAIAPGPISAKTAAILAPMVNHNVDEWFTIVNDFSHPEQR